MSENKRYYWLKLKEDFFDDDTIRYIEEQENGIKYSNFYLKLCLKSLRTDGRLVRFVGEMLIPYDIKSLSALTGIDADTVRCAMALFERIGCVKVLESGELYISQLAELVGSETDKAKLMRISRARGKAPELSGVTMLPERYPEIDIEKDIDIEKEHNTCEAVLSAVLSHYQDCITPTPPSTVSQMLIAYTDDLGPDVVIHAIDEAVNQRKLTWSYIQAILQRYSREGLNTLAKVEADEAERRKRKDAGTDKPAKRRDWGIRYTVDGRESGGNQ